MIANNVSDLQVSKEMSGPQIESRGQLVKGCKYATNVKLFIDTIPRSFQNKKAWSITDGVNRGLECTGAETCITCSPKCRLN